METPDFEYRIENRSDALALIEIMLKKLKGKPEKLCIPFSDKSLHTLKDAIERKEI
ncbi:hypothetical protein FACS189485_18080 [Spirochaetia bacterium]|nr:hypothetical protein FACS189476_06070 [Spirochaetia bacterium]GHV07567.1 hypothetical protein FACS189485_18080 [Spirochaetia bacterium]